MKEQKKETRHRRGVTHPNYGRSLPPETRAKIGEKVSQTAQEKREQTKGAQQNG